MPIHINQTEHDHIPEEFTVESLKSGGLTDEEIAALAAGDDPLLTIEDTQDSDGAENSAPGEIGNPAAAEQAAAAASPAPEAEPQKPEPIAPQIPDTSAAESVIAGLDAEIEALQDRYDDGELTRAEVTAKIKELTAAAAAAQSQIDAATAMTQNAAEQAVTHWKERLGEYQAAAPQLWAPEHLAHWDRHLRLVTSDEALATLSRDQQIRLAHARYAAEYEAINGAPLNIPRPGAAPKQAEEPKLQRRQDQRPEAPQTLAGINADTNAAIESSRFAAIDREIVKDPLAAERAFAQMTPDQQRAFLEEA